MEKGGLRLTQPPFLAKKTEIKSEEGIRWPYEQNTCLLLQVFTAQNMILAIQLRRHRVKELGGSFPKSTTDITTTHEAYGISS